MLGGIALRHTFDDDLGHIGYGVRPSARRRGLASWALGEVLVEARAALGVDRVLVPCLSDNTASARTIERCGAGVWKASAHRPRTGEALLDHRLICEYATAVDWIAPVQTRRSAAHATLRQWAMSTKRE